MKVKLEAANEQIKQIKLLTPTEKIGVTPGEKTEGKTPGEQTEDKTKELVLNA